MRPQNSFPELHRLIYILYCKFELLFLFFLLINGRLHAKRLCRSASCNLLRTVRSEMRDQMERFTKISDSCSRIFLHHSYDVCIITPSCTSRSTSSRSIGHCSGVQNFLIKLLDSAFADFIFLSDLPLQDTTFIIFDNQVSNLIRNLLSSHIHYLYIYFICCCSSKWTWNC